MSIVETVQEMLLSEYLSGIDNQRTIIKSKEEELESIEKHAKVRDLFDTSIIAQDPTRFLKDLDIIHGGSTYRVRYICCEFVTHIVTSDETYKTPGRSYFTIRPMFTWFGYGDGKAAQLSIMPAIIGSNSHRAKVRICISNNIFVSWFPSYDSGWLYFPYLDIDNPITKSINKYEDAASDETSTVHPGWVPKRIDEPGSSLASDVFYGWQVYPPILNDWRKYQYTLQTEAALTGAAYLTKDKYYLMDKIEFPGGLTVNGVWGDPGMENWVDPYYGQKETDAPYKLFNSGNLQRDVYSGDNIPNWKNVLGCSTKPRGGTIYAQYRESCSTSGAHIAWVTTLRHLPHPESVYWVPSLLAPTEPYYSFSTDAYGTQSCNPGMAKKIF